MNSDNKKKNRSLSSKIRAAALALDFPYKRLLRILALALIAAIVSGATLFSIARPFGLAMIAAAGGIGTAAAAAIGTDAGVS